MNSIASHADIQGLPIQNRIDFCEQELQRLTPPRTYRDRVLVNVYRYLLQSSLQQQMTSAPTIH